MFNAEHVIFCRDVQEGQTGFTYSGVLDTVFSTKYPSQVMPFLVFAKLRLKKEVTAQNELKLRIEIEHDNKPVWGVDFNLPQNPVPKNGVIYAGVEIKDLIFPQAGTYYVKLLHEGRLLSNLPLEGRPSTEMREVV